MKSSVLQSVSGMKGSELIITCDAPVLITGANGFIGSRVVETLLDYGFRNLRCFVRGSGNMATLSKLAVENPAKIKIVEGNLLSRDDCRRATKDVSLVYHLAAGTEKTFPGCYMNSVVSTRNLLDAILENGTLKRFVNISSIAVYSSADRKPGGVLDENSEVDLHPEERHEAYTYGKVKQEEMVLDYAAKHNIPYVIVRLGDVFGPGRGKISGKIGIDTFGLYLNLGGRNQVPLTYLDNCAEAIVMAGIKRGVDGEIFNVVDDDLPTSREFLKLYNRHVGKLKSLYIPYSLFYFLSYLWERYAEWSRGQLPPVFNRKRCVAHWKSVKYSNKKIKDLLGWKPKIQMDAALNRYFNYMRDSRQTHA